MSEIETQWLDSEEELRTAQRLLMRLGFVERSSSWGAGVRSVVLSAHDGYVLRIGWVDPGPWGVPEQPNGKERPEGP